MSKALVEKFLQPAIKRGRIKLITASGESYDVGQPAQGYPEITLRLTDNKVAADILRDARLGAGEAYMDGRIVIEEGDIMELAKLLRMNASWEEGSDIMPPSFLNRLTESARFILTSFNKAASSRKNASHHYDIGNDLYKLMLDPDHMQYSCAYWPEGVDNLQDAQTAKLAHIASKLALEPGHKVLDIGCGWGGLAIYLARHYDVTVHAITLADEQLALAVERAEEAGVADRVTFELKDYRDLAAEGHKYDRIASIGMFEHVGRPQFETFFDCTRKLMTDDGVMLLHTMGRYGQPGHTDAFTLKYIFPGGYIPALSETLAASEKSRLMHTDIETLRLHYPPTIRAWYDNCIKHKDAIIEMMDERFYRMWMFYLAGGATVMETGSMCVYQIQYAMNRRTLPITRGYMAEEEARLQQPAQAPASAFFEQESEFSPAAGN
ncbi:cyclopropane-fatty-acyl-phospholipid synthase [Altererythrobacter arenosus]|uniref:Cyclopropane-fatty-acyl-phospholipid synthase n=1 Tax=Altererythrobacter arenosus TaxID=3032592 RepID=A0ABY8FUB2_9SPHN|nr:cyclopropane-fatty-acyl-phospholipid synthase family protein [Altererythrobacter sp. CAU 1644]WFL76716.1 cyclopropane-fatty-acyl-phospholipid synthase [Altererythrobacter sp. CAU 1644]